MKPYFIGTLMVCALLVAATGCSSHHYRVTDPSSGKMYYTTKIDEAEDGEDAATLFATADERMFAAKREGRNRVVASEMTVVA